MLGVRFLAFVGAVATLVAQEKPWKRVDEIFHEWNKPGTPGAAVAVIKDGKLAYGEGYGIANLEYDIPIEPDTVFHVASVSKQFTAMAVVLLEQDHKLSLNDDIRKYLPELPDYGNKITIRNLLQHTSGIRDQWQTLALAGWRLDDVITQKQILRMLFRQKELNFDPGTRHLYSNGGYSLAAEIVARVSGKPFPEFCQERIFRPLGMVRTHFHDDHRRIVHDRAYSYEVAGSGFRASPLNYANVGATSLFTTGPDLVKWLDNFRDSKVGGSSAVARVQEQAVLADGRTIEYALGVSVGKYRGLQTISHGGADAGYRSFVVWFPEQQLGVAVLSNLSSFDAAGTANKVAEVYIGSEMTSEAPKPKIAVADAGSLGQYVGTYRLNVGTLMSVMEKENRLYASQSGETPFELKPLGPGRFYVERSNGEVEFKPAAGGGMIMRIVQGSGGTEGDRFTLAAFDPKDMAGYPGAYWSDELETQYNIFVRDGKLLADHAHHGEFTLMPVGKDEFRTSMWFMPEVRFVRDAAGRVAGIRAGGGRVAGVSFARR